jgi:hypothetical protein
MYGVRARDTHTILDQGRVQGGCRYPSRSMMRFESRVIDRAVRSIKPTQANA